MLTHLLLYIKTYSRWYWRSPRHTIAHTQDANYSYMLHNFISQLRGYDANEFSIKNHFK